MVIQERAGKEESKTTHKPNTMLFKLNKSKAIEALLFVCNRLDVADEHKVSKILYYADKIHLGNYGRMITGDRYVKMKFGPVPSAIRDLISENRENQQFLEVDSHYLSPLRKENIEELSESDIEALNQAIEEHGHKSFKQLTEESHDKTWKAGTLNRRFNKEQFLLTFPDRRELDDYLKNQH